MYHTETINNHTFRLRYLPGGVFSMGNNRKDEGPIHRVDLSPFYIGEYPVTQALWKAVMGEDDNSAQFASDNRPVERVSWTDIMEGNQDDTGQPPFLQMLNQATENTRPSGYEYRLPTEAQWEYAARGGESYEYAGSDQLKEVGWCKENSYGETKVLGLKCPNGFQLYDLSGNVREWCLDKYSGSFYQSSHNERSIVKDPICEMSSARNRVLRGGSWINYPQVCSVSYRIQGHPSSRSSSIGFRLVLVSSSRKSGGLISIQDWRRGNLEK